MRAAFATISCARAGSGLNNKLLFNGAKSSAVALIATPATQHCSCENESG
jgi:hypothetical protein